MNERIKELALESRIAYYSKNGSYEGSDNGLSVIPSTQSLEKFAELLIRECVGKCEFVADMAEITNTGEMARKTKATADSCARMIKQHFGVKECV